MKEMNHRFKIGEWVSWYSPTRKRIMQGQIANLEPGTAYILVTTWDGRMHHWREAYKKLRRIPL